MSVKKLSLKVLKFLELKKGKETKKLVDKQIRELKKKYSMEEVQKFQAFSKEFSTRIKKIRNLNQSQIDQILLQIGLAK